jgi:cytochrome c oxidase subunit IV
VSHQQPTGAPARPADVTTGFWLWLVALPLLSIGYLVDVFTVQKATTLGIALTSLFVLTLGAVVLTFMLLMRSGYRWTRTLLTAGGVATVIYTAASLFSVPREPVAAVTFAVTGIIGSVLIGGGTYLLHRPDAHGFFVK